MREKSFFTYEKPSEVLDALNVSLLAELQRDPRLSLAELGRRVGLSSPAVAIRLRRLEENGIIQGYQVNLEPASLGLPICAYIRVRPNPGQLVKVAELASQIPEVIACDRITGEDCFIIKIYLPRMDQLDRVLDRFLMYGSTTTSIVQSSPVPLRPLPLPDLQEIQPYQAGNGRKRGSRADFARP